MSRDNFARIARTTVLPASNGFAATMLSSSSLWDRSAPSGRGSRPDHLVSNPKRLAFAQLVPSNVVSTKVACKSRVRSEGGGPHIGDSDPVGTVIRAIAIRVGKLFGVLLDRANKGA